ncbi:MAG: hypothetical protein WB919_17030 [Candidatus Sulfotelmatobacter sp.]
MLGVVGHTVIEVIVGVIATTLSVALPLSPINDAVTAVEPVATAVARPVEFTVATAVFAAVQLAVELTFPVEPSLYVAVAENCCVAPTETLALAGVTAMDVTVFATADTVKVEFPLTPLSEAVIVVEPEATAFAMPLELTVATAGVAAVQLALEVTFAVELSLYVAVAVNCCVAPTPILVLEGVTAIAVIVFVVAVELAGMDWHPVLAIISEKERKKAAAES